MATKPDAAKADAAKPGAQDADAQQPVRSTSRRKKLLLVGGVFLLVLALAGGGWVYLAKKQAASADEEPVVQVEPKGPPTFFPMDHMVVNLADPGGEKVAQVGITLELADSKAADKIKMYLPSIRSAILLLISQRTSDEILMIEGKEKLASDILNVALRPFEADNADHSAPKAKKSDPKAKKQGMDESPVQAVLFSSFIVQ